MASKRWRASRHHLLRGAYRVAAQKAALINARMASRQRVTALACGDALTARVARGVA